MTLENSMVLEKRHGSVGYKLNSTEILLMSTSKKIAVKCLDVAF